MIKHVEFQSYHISVIDKLIASVNIYTQIHL